MCHSGRSRLAVVQAAHELEGGSTHGPDARLLCRAHRVRVPASLVRFFCLVGSCGRPRRLVKSWGPVSRREGKSVSAQPATPSVAQQSACHCQLAGNPLYLVWGHFETKGLNLGGNLRKCDQAPLPHTRSGRVADAVQCSPYAPALALCAFRLSAPSVTNCKARRRMHSVASCPSGLISGVWSILASAIGPHVRHARHHLKRA